MNNRLEFLCSEPLRLDLFLAKELDQTRSQTAQLIKQEVVSVDGKIVNRAGVKLKVGQSIVVVLPQPKQTEPLEVNFDVEILYEDEDLLVINKPTGVTVHGAPSVKDATLVDWLKHKGVRLSTISGEERHGIVHRLDKGTSGVMVVAKNNESHEFLSQQLQDKSMGRYYLAVITPKLKENLTVVECSIARSSANRLKMGCNESGKYAKSAFAHLALSNDETKQLIACKLFTGRTHQIRVHLESMSRHIIGDHLYGGTAKGEGSVNRIMLHAYSIYFIHPKTKKIMQFQAPLDTNMQKYIEEKFQLEEDSELFNSEYITHCFN